MGIDVYLRWDGQTEEEKQAQYTGFSTVSGHVGYLREAYHGGPYATKVLCEEGWDQEEVLIPASVLRERLTETIKAAKQRYLNNYSQEISQEEIDSFVNFVELAEKLETEGKNPRVIVSG